MNKKRELFKRHKNDVLSEDSVYVSDITEKLVALSSSLLNLEIQDNKQEGKRAAMLCNELIDVCGKMKLRIRAVRVEMGTK